MRSFLIAMQFLTRIKIKKTVEINAENFGRSGLYFPLVGLIIGLILALSFFFISRVFQPLSSIIILLTLEIIITGGLHLDGFMDSCDGIFSGREREKILEIMKDSRVGSMGVLGIILLLGLKTAFFLEVPPIDLIPVIIVMPMLGRLAMIWVIVSFPSARDNGLGGFFQKGTGGINFILIALFVLVLCIIILPFKMVSTVLLTMLSTYYVSHRINTLLKGHTGDTYGAISEVTELFFIFWYVIVVFIFNKLLIL